MAKEQSFAQGKNEGIQQTKQQQEEKISTLLQKHLSSIDALIAIENKREVEKHIQSLELAIRVIKQTLPTLANTYAIDEIQEKISKDLKTRKDEALINIHIPDVHSEQLTKRIKEMIEKNHYSNQINILSNTNINDTDYKIEWLNGSIEKSFEKLLQAIEKEFNIAKAGLEIEANNAGDKPSPDILAKKAELDSLQQTEENITTVPETEEETKE